MTTLAKVANRILIAANSGTGVRLTRTQVQLLADAIRGSVSEPPMHTFDTKQRASDGAQRAQSASPS